ncbi:hypothetical protein LZK98_15635 [Sphingomonas cannabina]|uniref:hypothetical protein n=1 Tax=Sphingomonas cannabina TaxID=2899123 RepID=UPI001F20B93E|nr:hypothetical protein [Sphingomonas cannabina]UIJ44481.1 hypothetical protein LZK98_15635 [Sphingomonas cannabina]
MNTRRLALAAASALALTLAACSGSEPTPAPTNDAVDTTTEEVVNEAPPVVNEAPVAEPTANATATPAPAVTDDRSADEQMYDDADATGMTARVDRSGGGSNESAPTGVTEEK